MAGFEYRLPVDPDADDVEFLETTLYSLTTNYTLRGDYTTTGVGTGELNGDKYSIFPYNSLLFL